VTAAARRRRWREDGELTVAVLSGLAGGEGLDDLPVGRTGDGRLVALRALSPRQRVGTVHRRELEPLADEVIALLRKLEDECR